MVTAAMKLKGACSLKKSYDLPRQHIKNFPTKVCLVIYGFPVFMYGCDSWTTKKAEHGRIDALSCAVEKTL